MKQYYWGLTFLIIAGIVAVNSSYNTSNEQVQEVVVHKKKYVPRVVRVKHVVPNNSRSVASVVPERSLEQLENCYFELCSGFPNNDAREYELAVGYAIAEKLAEINDEWSDRHVNFDNHLPMILKYIGFNDGYVVEAALDMLSKTTPNNESYDVLINLVSTVPDPVLVEMACDELLKYDEFSNEDIKNTIYDVIDHGAVTVTSTAAHQLIRFVTVDDIPVLEELQSHFDPNSEVYKIIGSTIERL